MRPEKKTRSVVVTWPSRERTKPGRNCLLTLSSFLFSEFILWVSPLSQWSTWSRAPSLRGWEQPALLQDSLVWPSQVAFPTPPPFSWMSSRRFWQEVCNSVQPKLKSIPTVCQLNLLQIQLTPKAKSLLFLCPTPKYIQPHFSNRAYRKGWSVIPDGLGQRGFWAAGHSVVKPERSQANWDQLVTFCNVIKWQ